jgi:hypothetical protein
LYVKITWTGYATCTGEIQNANPVWNLEDDKIIIYLRETDPEDVKWIKLV